MSGVGFRFQLLMMMTVTTMSGMAPPPSAEGLGFRVYMRYSKLRTHIALRKVLCSYV